MNKKLFQELVDLIRECKKHSYSQDTTELENNLLLITGNMKDHVDQEILLKRITIEEGKSSLLIELTKLKILPTILEGIDKNFCLNNEVITELNKVSVETLKNQLDNWKKLKDVKLIDISFRKLEELINEKENKLKLKKEKVI